MKETGPWFMENGSPMHPNWKVLWQDVVSRYSKMPAYVSQNEIVSFELLYDSAEYIARQLKENANWQPGICVLVPVEEASFLQWMIAVWNVGGVCVPVTESAALAEPRWAAMVACHSKAKLQGLSHIPAFASVPELALTRIGKTISNNFQHPWHAIYSTSGSTGNPRAVVRGWRQAIFEAGSYAEVLGLQPQQSAVMLVDPVFGASTKHMLGCLLSGICQYFPNRVGGTLPESADILHAAPSQLLSLALKQKTHHSFKTVSLTGEAPSRESWDALRRFMPSNGRVLNALGGSEFGVAANMLTTLTPTPTPFLGVPLRGKKITVQSDDDNSLPYGESGLLCVRSDFIAEGYLDYENGKSILSPFVDRSVLTGDIATILPDGHISLLGRSGSMLKQKGKWLNVQPLKFVIEGHPQVKSCAIVAAPEKGTLIAWIAVNDLSQELLATILAHISLDPEIASLGPIECRLVEKFVLNRHNKLDIKATEQAIIDGRKKCLSGNLQNKIAELVRMLTIIDEQETDISNEIPLTNFNLDSLEINELAIALESATGNFIPVSLLHDGGMLGDIRVKLRTRDKNCFYVFGNLAAEKAILWFGDGVGIIKEEFGKDTQIWHWDHTRHPVKASSIAAFVADMLDLAPLERLPNQFLIGGFSFGALLATEAARELVLLGKFSSHVFLIDPPTRTDRRRMAQFIYVISSFPFVDKFIVAQKPKFRRYFWKRFRAHLISRYKWQSLPIPSSVFSSNQFYDQMAVYLKALPIWQVTHIPLGPTHIMSINSTEQIDKWANSIRAKLC